MYPTIPKGLVVLGLVHIYLWLTTKFIITVTYELFRIYWFSKFWFVYNSYIVGIFLLVGTILFVIHIIKFFQRWF